MRLVKVLLLVIFFVCSIIFFIQNMATLSQPLALRFDPLPTYTKVEAPSGHSPVAELDEVPRTEERPRPGIFAWQSDGVPLYIVILTTFMLGVLVSCMFFLLERVRSGYVTIGQRRMIKRMDRQIEHLNAELEKARIRPKVTLEPPAGKTVTAGAAVKELPRTADEIKQSEKAS